MKTIPPITHVALRFQEKIYSLPSPNRHHHVRDLIVKQTGYGSYVDVPLEDEGFLDAEGIFLDRHRALIRARFCGQIKDESKVRAKMLTSEDVW